MPLYLNGYIHILYCEYYLYEKYITSCNTHVYNG